MRKVDVQFAQCNDNEQGNEYIVATITASDKWNADSDRDRERKGRVPERR